MNKTDEYQVRFRGTAFFAFVPMIIFLILCVTYFVIFKVFDMNVLAVGGSQVFFLERFFKDL
ncbi:hypothetical protein [Pseudoramibacter faecis]|uniref:hypothetical protein n=1 Tax=Pseudoramibacter faecis TaxID=3108534 RepID=UPI002E7A31E1|nr:hypothetical protein [Pseudoramibacter sp. HA2172]